MNRIRGFLTRRNLLATLVVLVVAVVGTLLIAGGVTSASSPTAPLDNYLCTPNAVAAFSVRVHVRCSVPTPQGIAYFAVCTSNGADANRFLSIFTTAKVTAKNLMVFYTPSDTSGTACGCSTVDCRLVWGAEVQQ